jgi:hypothetical protein
MSVAGFLTDQVGAGRSLSVGPTTGLGETVGASFDYTWKSHTTAAAIQYQGMPLNERNDTIKQRFGQDIFDITKLREKYPNPSSEGRLQMTKEANDQIDGWIERGRTQAPDKYKGIKTTKEIREEARKTVDISENHMAEIMARNPSTLSRMTGGFVGGIGAAMLDPPNLATLPFGAGEVQAGLKGFAAARAVLKAAAIDGTINAAVEASSQPAIAAWQKELGRRYGLGDAAENVALAFVGGTALSGLIRGGVRGVKGAKDYVGSVSADILDRIASSEKLPASVRDAAAFMSRQAHIDESAPPGMIKTGEDLKLHRDTAQRVTDDFEAYQTQTAAKETLAPKNDNVAQGQDIEAEGKSQKPAPETAQPAIPQEAVDIVARYDDVEAFVKDSLEGKNDLLKIQSDSQKAAGESVAALREELAAVEKEGFALAETLKGKKPTKKLRDLQVRRESLSDKVFYHERGGSLTGIGGADIVKNRAALTDFYNQVRGRRVDPMDDLKPPERMEELDLPEGIEPQVSADRVAIAESDLKGLTEELGDETIVLDDGRELSINDFAKEIEGKKNLIEAMKTCRIA